jgi:hypothetical protein
MIVWVLIITMAVGGGSGSVQSDPRYMEGAAVAVIDNIATDQSCQQLAVIIRQQRGVSQATCAPVRKMKP